MNLEDGLCARRGCPSLATHVPVVQVIELPARPASVVRTLGPLTTLAHCRACTEGIVRPEQLLGAAATAELFADAAAAGVTPAGGIVYWRKLA